MGRLLALWLLFAVRVQATTVSGVVYLDRNQDGQRQAGEPGVAAVAVSDGHQVVRTGGDGSYRVESAEEHPIIWFTVPRDRRPVGRFWQAPTDGKADFALRAEPQSDHFQFIQITDTHVGRADLVRAFCERVNAFPVPVSFVINTGDLVSGVDVVLPEQAPAQYDTFAKCVAGLQPPLFVLPGNHEHVGFNNPKADKQSPLYGKGLYHQRYGPTYYSWDWARLHLIALDGTRLPYAEALGPEQLAWLAEDLKLQPAGQPVVLFCHQALQSLRDREALLKVLAGHHVLAGFCGHLHAAFEAKLGDIPVHMTGAMSGSWWSGPNPDGAPQGFAFVRVDGDKLTQVYTGREGPWSMDLRSLRTTELHSGRQPVEVSVLDCGREVTLTARCGAVEVPLQRAERQPLWSLWRGELDTATALDGLCDLTVTATGEGRESRLDTRFVVRNGRDAPPAAPADGVLRIAVRDVDAADEVLFNGEPLGTLQPGTPSGTTVEFAVPAARLRRLNRVVVRAAAQGAGKDSFGIGPVQIKMGKVTAYDLRYASFNQWRLNQAHPEVEIFICLP